MTPNPTTPDEPRGCYGVGDCEVHSSCLRYWSYVGKDSNVTPIPFCGRPGYRPNYIPIVPAKQPV